MNTVKINDEIHRNFHLFWDNFPFPVMLIYKDRSILARNRSAEEIGIPVGVRCTDLSVDDSCKRCQATQALKEQRGKRLVSYYAPMEKVLDSYWIPLEGEADLYLHFGIDITDFAAEHLFPKTCADNEHHCESCAG